MANNIQRANPTRGWTMWHRDQVFEERSAQVLDRDLWVVNVGDLVFEPPYMFYLATAVDDTTRYATLERIDPSKGLNDLASDPDSLNDGLRTYQPHISQRLFVDTSFEPAKCDIDARVRIYEREAVSCKFVLGTDVTSNAAVISQNVNSGNVVTSETVDLYNLFSGNDSIKRPTGFHTFHDLNDGDTVTMITYSNTGNVVGLYHFRVTLSKNIVGPNASNVYIDNIELISPMRSKTDTSLIEVPLNSSLNTSVMRCRVHYSNGLSKDVDIDGVKVRLLGLDNFNMSQTLEHKVVLSYYLSEQEQAINAQGQVPQIPREYRIVARKQNEDDVAFRIWMVPRFDLDRYRLTFYLTDLEQSMFTDITDVVTVTQDNGQNFNGMLFGMRQRLYISVLLDDVVYNAYPGLTHVQTTDILLYDPEASQTHLWEIDYVADGNNVFGPHAVSEARLLDNKQFTVHGDYQSEYDWLTAMYGTLDPLYDSQELDQMPYPTHFTLSHNGTELGPYPVSDYYKTFELGVDGAWAPGEPMLITFRLMIQGGDRVMAVAPLTLQYL